MGKLLGLITTAAAPDTPPAPPRLLAPQVGEKLAAADARLAGLKTQIAELALDEALARPGAPEKLAALNKQIGGAQIEADQLRLAHRLALTRDARSTAEARARIRSAQFAAMGNHARGRFEAMVEMCVGLETAAKAYRRYLDLTDKMAAALPIGTTFPAGMSAYSMELKVDGKIYPSELGPLIAGEMFRHAGVADPEHSGLLLPGAHPPTMAMAYQPDAIEPISESVRRINEHFLATVKDQIEAMERAEEERIAQGNFAATN
jgi:hypothetical protein